MTRCGFHEGGGAVRAVVLNRFGGPGSVEVAEAPAPEAADGQVLVDVVAGALGSWDIAATSGAFVGAGGTADFPQIQGWDFAGTIASVGVDGLTPGTVVVGFTPQPWSRIGAFAERIAVPADFVCAVGQEIEAADAATLPVSAVTANLLLDTAAATAGESVLIIGAAGNVGGMTAQLAAYRGLKVFGSAASADFGRLGELGVAHPIDRDADVSAQVRDVLPDGVDIVVDLVGGRAAEQALAAATDAGRFVSSIPTPPPSERSIQARNVAVTPDKPALDMLLGLVADSVLSPVPIAGEFPLDAAAQAYAQVAGGVKGKVALMLR